MKNWWTKIIILVAFVSQMLIMWPSGSRYCFENKCGDYYWGVHEHDGIWHMALGETAFNSGSLQMPTFSGEKLTEYNWLIDYPLYLFSKVGIPVGFTYFKLLPTLWFILMIWVWRKFASQYRPNDEGYFRWLLFWLFFSNSLSYIFTLWHAGVFTGSSSYISMQPPMMLINLQFSYTLVILGYILTMLTKTTQIKHFNFIVSGLLFIAMGLKFYGGAVLLALVVVHALLFKKWGRIIYSILTVMLAVVIFYQPKLGQTAIMTVNPLATVYPIIEEKSLFYFPRLAAAIYSDSVIKQVAVGGIALLIFVIFNFGMRLIAIVGWKKWTKFDWSLILTTMIALGANVILVQRGEWWNTVQFLYYGYFLIGILAAKQMSVWSNKSKWIGITAGIFVVLTSVPNALDTWRVFAQYPPGSYVSDQEKDILSELKILPDGVVMALPLQRSEIGSSQSPSPLYLRYESAYVSAYTGKATYFNDTVQSRLVGIDYSQREKAIKNIECDVLNQVDYVYVAGDQIQLSDWLKCGVAMELVKINEAASLYKVK